MLSQDVAADSKFLASPGTRAVRASIARARHARLAALIAALLIAAPSTPSARADDDAPTETDRRAREKNKAPAANAPGPAPTTDRAAPATSKPSASKPAASGTEGDAIPTRAGGWCIAIALFRDEEQQREAPAVLARIRTEGGLPDAYLQARGPATLIAVGNFPDSDDPRAQSELKRVQQLEVGGSRPYIAAYLTPPPTAALQGRTPQYNLLRAKEMLGDRAVYTLQIAVYGRQDLPRASDADLAEARKAAEQAALQLRQEGEQAFYYHGPRMSMVTIGVFDTSDFDPQFPRLKSSRLLAAQKRHPHNLYNGAAIKEKQKGAPERLQPSNLVAIPTK